MFCPNCSEAKTNHSTQYCRKCGLDLNGLTEYIESGGSAEKEAERSDLPSKGLRQGLLLIAVGILLIPVWMFISAAFPPDDRLVESAPSTTAAEATAWILMWIAFLSGAIRVAYSFVFRSASHFRASEARDDNNLRFADKPTNAALPDGASFEAARPGRWRITDELLEQTVGKANSSAELR